MSNGVPFLKVQGAGNDFVLVDARGANAALGRLDWESAAARVCDRHYGVGADGILLAEDSGAAAAKMRIVNADGSDGGMCGNGLRCFSRYLVELGGVEPSAGTVAVETGAGVLHARFDGGGAADAVTVDVGRAWLEPEQIPVRALGAGPVLHHQITAAGEELDLACVSMGNPHAVLFTHVDVDEYALEEIGPLVETHPDFPKRTNFEIVNVLAPDHLRVRVWERGVGLTLACGTGACAVLVAARLRGLAGPTARVELPGGDLRIDWPGEGSVVMTGPAHFSFHGELPREMFGDAQSEKA